MSWDLRKVRKNGTVLWVRETARAVLRGNDPIVLIACEDITERKRAEERIRQDERELRQLIDFLPQHIFVLGPDGSVLHANQLLLDYTGHTLEEVREEEHTERAVHPDDLDRVSGERQRGLSSGAPFETELRMLGKDRQYRCFLFRYKPLLDEAGRIVRWCGTATDVEDRKRAEETVRRENLALREEIDKTSMFEEIVGASPALQAVLARVSKITPTDSTVLISAETGTGKELNRAGHPQAVAAVVARICKRELCRDPAVVDRLGIVRS